MTDTISARAKEQIIKLIAEKADGCTREQILSAICARQKTARQALKYLLENKIIRRVGYGTRNFPFQYFLNISSQRDRHFRIQESMRKAPSYEEFEL